MLYGCVFIELSKNLNVIPTCNRIDRLVAAWDADGIYYELLHSHPSGYRRHRRAGQDHSGKERARMRNSNKNGYENLTVLPDMPSEANCEDQERTEAMNETVCVRLLETQNQVGSRVRFGALAHRYCLRDQGILRSVQVYAGSFIAPRSIPWSWKLCGNLLLYLAAIVSITLWITGSYPFIP